MSDWGLDEEEGGKWVAEMKEGEYYGGGAGGALQFDAVHVVFGMDAEEVRELYRGLAVEMRKNVHVHHAYWFVEGKRPEV